MAPSAGAESLATCAPAHTNLDKLICAHPDLREAAYTAKIVSIEMRFDRISEDAMGRICDTYSAQLTGTVMLDHGRPYIYVPELF
ncbi:MAG TPA: hypothetical protein VGI89_09605, partial [Rhizomicrobium sp.]